VKCKAISLPSAREQNTQKKKETTARKTRQRYDTRKKKTCSHNGDILFSRNLTVQNKKTLPVCLLGNHAILGTHPAR
jgi:hypothetical protein